MSSFPDEKKGTDVTLPPPDEEIKVRRGMVGLFIPADQQRILKLAQQGYRPAAIAAILRLPPGHSQRVWEVFTAYGIIPIDTKRMHA